jgi:hypothetical protein
MSDVVTLIYPDGTTEEETLDAVPKVGERMGSLTVARVQMKGPDDEVDTAVWVYLKSAKD